jgi:HEAT repeat protein
VQVKLDEVYISLRAQHEVTPEAVDRSLQEQEMAQLEAKTASSRFSAEKVQDQSEHLITRTEIDLFDSKNVVGEVLELAEVSKRHDRVVILGDPGSGKSTLLRYLALKHAQALWYGRTDVGSDLGNTRFPILIRIADYAEYGIPQGKSLSDFLTDYYRMHECPHSGLTDLLVSELAAGNCLVLLDGLDEIVNPDDRRKVAERIEDFVVYHSNRSNYFIITSRRAGYRSAPLGEPFLHYVVQDMDEAQIRRFLERWCKGVELAQTPDLSQEVRDAVAKREIDAIMKAVQTSLGVRRLATNPLLLRTLALIHRTGAHLPQKRIELYKLAADTLARTWRTTQGIPESVLIEDKYLTRLLGSLAYWIHENKPTGIAIEQEVYEVLGREYARIRGMTWDEDNPDIDREVKKFLRAVREHTGLFVERAPKRYGFMHLTFEEYYVARHLVARSRDRAQLIREQLHKPRWEEPILLALGFVGLDSPDDAAELLETAIMAEGEEAEELNFIHSSYEELLGRDFLFALRCLGDNIPVRPSFLQKIVRRLADELLYQTGSSKFLRYRQALDEQLGYLKGSEAGSALATLLIEAIIDPNPLVVSRAALNLERLGEHASELEMALCNLLNEEKSTARSIGARSLGQLELPSSKAIDALLEALDDKSDVVRYNALWSLGQLDHPLSLSVATALIDFFKIDEHITYESPSRQAVFALGKWGRSSPVIVTMLLQALMDNDPTIRFHAAWSLGHTGLTSPDIVEALTHSLNDPDYRVSDYASWSLAQLHPSSPSVEAILLQKLHDSNIVRLPEARNSNIMSHLVVMGCRANELVTALLHTLKKGNSTDRYYAARDLGNLGDSSDEIVTALLCALKDKSPTARAGSALALKQLNYPSSETMIRALIDGLAKGGFGLVRAASAGLLGKIGKADELTIEALLCGLIDNLENVRTVCAQALAQLGYRFPNATRIIEKKLIRAIEDPEFDKLDDIGSPGHDYAYSCLWLLVIGSELEGR